MENQESKNQEKKDKEVIKNTHKQDKNEVQEDIKDAPIIKFSIKNNNNDTNSKSVINTPKIRKKSRLEIFFIDPRILITISIIMIFGSLAIILQTSNVRWPWENRLKQIPYLPKQIVVTAEMSGVQNTPEEGQIWDVTLSQISNIYVSVYKNETVNTNDRIKEIKINNIQFIQQSQIGNLMIKQIPEAAPNENLISSEILYKPQQNKIESNLALYKDGGIIGFRYLNSNIGVYHQEEVTSEVIYDGKLVAATNITAEQLKTVISFDLNIYTEAGLDYKTTIQVEVPIDKFMQEGYGLKEYTDFSALEYVKI